MADDMNIVDTPIGDLTNLANAPDDALLVVEYLGKAYNSTLGQLKAALGAITSFERTQGDGTPGSTDVYTVTFANGGKLEMPIPIAKNGTDAVSPTAEATETDTGWHIVITDKNGKHPFDITNGKNGKNGVSPTAKVTATDEGWHVVITDKNGEHPFDITNGKDGSDGVSPTAQVTATDEGWHVVITDKNGEHPFDLLHGLNGKDGVSPDVSVQQVSGGYRVTITDKDGAHYFTLKNGESSSADWAQKYPDGVGYVKNRIAYKDVYGVDGEVIVGNVDFIAGIANVAGLMKDALEPGGKYVVRWNNQPYHCICKESLTDGPYIGNGALFGGAEDLENTGEPFCIYRFTEDYYQIIKDTDTEETVSVEVYGFAVTDLKRMDGDLLTEGVPYKEVIGEDAEIIPLTTATFTAENGSIVTGVSDGMKEGVKYVVTLGGLPLEGRCKKYGNTLYIGDGHMYNSAIEETGEGFCVAALGGTDYNIYLRNAVAGASLKAEMHSVQEIIWHKLEKEALPDDVGGVKTVNGNAPDENGNVEVEGVTDYNKLENTPCRVVMSEVLPEMTADLIEGTLQFSSPLTLVEGYKYIVTWNGVDYECICNVDTAAMGGIEFYWLGNGEYVNVETEQMPFFIGNLAAYGINILREYDGSTSVTLSIRGETVEKLDKKFLPEHIHSFKTLTDKPFYAERNDEIILSETTGVPNPDMDGGITLPDVLDVKVGNVYAINWNGVEYFCEAKPSPAPEAFTGIVMGRAGVLTGDLSGGDPFLFICFPEDIAGAYGFGCLVTPFDGSAVVTMSINGATVHTLSSAYLPKIAPIADVTSAPTAEQFNALLAALRNAGYMAI